MELKEIGRVHSPYKKRGDAPCQGKLKDTISEIEIFDEYLPGIKSLDELSHIIVLYWGDRADRSVVETKTPFSDRVLGVFSTRSPNRPNPIAFCVCEILEVGENTITVKNLDALDGSPVLDIKVYSAKIDCYPEANRK